MSNQTGLSRFFSVKKKEDSCIKKTSHSKPTQKSSGVYNQSNPKAEVIIDLCDDAHDAHDVDNNAGMESSSGAQVDTPIIDYFTAGTLEDVSENSGFSSMVSRAFDGDRKDIDVTTNESESSKAPIKGKGKSNASGKKDPYTPLERQVVDLKASHSDCLLMVECGYRIRFFGEDATIAGKVLSIYAHKDRQFMVASIPTHRFLVHCRRLVNVGYRVGLVRQTETAAIRQASGKSSSKTFERSVVGIYTPGTPLDENDPAFSDIIRANKTSGNNKMDLDDEDDFGDGDDEGDGEGEKSIENEHQKWMSCIFFEDEVLTIVSVDPRGHHLRFCSFKGDSFTQELLDYMDVLRPVEVVCDAGMHDSIWSSLKDRCRGVVNTSVARLLVDSIARNGNAQGEDMTYITRLCTWTDGSSSSSSKKWTVEIIVQMLKDANIVSGIGREVARAWSLLASYLEPLRLSDALIKPVIDNDNASIQSNDQVGGNVEDATNMNAAVSNTMACKLQRTYFRLDPVTARDLEVFSVMSTNSNAVSATFEASSVPSIASLKKNLGRSLFTHINYCKTSYGRRVLRGWLECPLTDIAGLQERQEAIRWISHHKSFLGVGKKGSTSKGEVGIDSTWIQCVSENLTAPIDVESMLSSMIHKRISPLRLVSLLQWCTKFAGLASMTADINDNNNNSNSNKATLPKLLRRQFDKKSLDTIVQCANSILMSFRDGINEKEGTGGVVIKYKCDYHSSHPVCADTDLDQDQDEDTSIYSKLDELVAEKRNAEHQMHEVLKDIRRLLRKSNLEYKTLNTGGGSCIEHLVEVSNTPGDKALVPSDWVSMNSTKNILRYHPPQVLAAQATLYRLRDEVNRQARQTWAHFLQYRVCTLLHQPLRVLLNALATLDALISLSILGDMPGYCQPLYGDSTNEIDLKGARHPMAAYQHDQKGAEFQPNDVKLRINGQNRSCLIITGPNMGGKSSYVRMVSLVCLMGQIGAHVPAEFASLPILDNIFTRMGSGDDLAMGRSTFMTELYRTAKIIRCATSRSLVVLDELGRGTSTHDGVSIALATLKHFVSKIQCGILFVTHYSQVSRAVDILPELIRKAQNVHMGYIESFDEDMDDEEGIGQEESDKRQMLDDHQAVVAKTSTKRKKSHVLFLYQAVEGASKGSYGLNVARLAGLDDALLDMAEEKSQWMQNQMTSTTQNSIAHKSISLSSTQKRPQQSISSNTKEDVISHKFQKVTNNSNTGSNDIAKTDDDAIEKEKAQLEALIRQSQQKLQVLSAQSSGNWKEGESLRDQFCRLVEVGDIEAARALYGDEEKNVVSLQGVVVHGEKRGRELGFPTANVSGFVGSSIVIPADGVYSGWLILDDSTPARREELQKRGLLVNDKGARYPAAIHIGKNDTFVGVRERQVEAHALQLEEWVDLYSLPCTVVFLKRVRPTVKFEGADWLEQLLTQMKKDCEQCLVHCLESGGNN